MQNRTVHISRTLNLTLEIERLVTDIVNVCPEFSHIDPARLLICVNSSRSSSHGAFAKIHHLRFQGGHKEQTLRRGRNHYRCRMPEINHLGVDILYVIYFTLPRFIDRPFRDKLVTIFHELFHISPRFDGDIRRFPGKNFAHGSSAKKYNLLMDSFVEIYLQSPTASVMTDFLHHDMAALREKYRTIVGRRLAMPRIAIEKI